MMEALLLLCLLGGDDFRWAVERPSFSWSTRGGGHTSAASPQDAESSPTDGLSDYVHRINVANQGGSCVCIGDGVFITCKHVFEGVGVRDVRIDGQAVAASVTFAPSHDVAIVRLGSGAAAAPLLLPMGNILPRTETPAHMCECRAFGHGSEVIHTGVYSNDDTLSLMPGPGGITQGDSGGGVFCDGQLVGVIRGKNPGNSRVCYFTPLSDVAALVAPFSPEAEPEAAPGADSKRVFTAQEYIDGEFISPRILKFEATWCGPCHSQDISEWVLKSGWTLEHVDVDERPEVMQAFRVTSIPTYVVIRNGSEVGRYTGTSKAAFLPILKRAVQ